MVIINFDTMDKIVEDFHTFLLTPYFERYDHFKKSVFSMTRI
jgi:hypothetical protein